MKSYVNFHTCTPMKHALSLNLFVFILNYIVLYYRVVGAVANSREFAEAFECKEGSPMNPEDKCELW